jgi:hypothetical protein
MKILFLKIAKNHHNCLQYERVLKIFYFHIMNDSHISNITKLNFYFVVATLIGGSLVSFKGKKREFLPQRKLTSPFVDFLPKKKN